MSRKTARIVLLGALALLGLVTPATASAASISIVAAPDAAEDRPLSVTFAVTAPAAGGDLIARVRPAGGAPCGATSATDPGGDSIAYTVIHGSESVQRSFIVDEPGNVLICAWLQDRQEAVAPPASLLLPVRGTIANAVAAVAASAGGHVLNVTGNVELSRELYATTKPLGATGCAASRQLDTGSSLIGGRTIEGAYTTATDLASLSPGSAYLICVWVQESHSDLSAEAATQTVVVMPPSCESVRARIAASRKAARKERTLAARARANARRAHGAAKRRLRRQATTHNRRARVRDAEFAAARAELKGCVN